MTSAGIKALFKLSSNENIFDDFDCDINMRRGKLYVCENHICLHSDFLEGIKDALEFEKIDEILQNKSTLEVKSKGKIYKLSGFKDIGAASDCITACWSSCCPGRNIIESDKVSGARCCFFDS